MPSTVSLEQRRAAQRQMIADSITTWRCSVRVSTRLPPQLPDGRRLCFSITSTCRILPAQEQPT